MNDAVYLKYNFESKISGRIRSVTTVLAEVWIEQNSQNLVNKRTVVTPISQYSRATPAVLT